MKKKNNNIIKTIIFIIIAFVPTFLLATFGNSFRQYQELIVPMCVNIMLAVSLNLVTGFLGELSLGHAGFMSIGAYTGALITMNLSDTMPPALAFTLAIICGGIVAALFGFLIGVPVLRLRGDYLAIVTLGFGEIIKSIINVLGPTGGAKGLRSIPTYSTYENFIVPFILAVITVLIIKNLVNSRDGRAIMAVRDNDIAAESIGIKVSSFKIKAFVIGAFFAGIAGVIYGHNVGIIKPTTFDYNKSIEILVMVVLGGMGSIPGSIIAAIILTVLPELLRGADEFRMLLYAIILIIIMIANHSKIKEGLMVNKTTKKLLNRRKEQA